MHLTTKKYYVFNTKMFQLAGEAERHGILKPLENSYLQLHTSLLELMKYTKSRCKGYKEYFSKYQEDLDSSLNEDKRIGKYLFLSLKVNVITIVINFKDKGDNFICH